MTCGQIYLKFTHSPTFNIGTLHSEMAIATAKHNNYCTIVCTVIVALILAKYLLYRPDLDLPGAAKRFALTLRIRSVASRSSALCKQENLWPMIGVCLEYLRYQACSVKPVSKHNDKPIQANGVQQYGNCVCFVS